MELFNFNGFKKEERGEIEKISFISEERISKMMLEITEYPFGKTDTKELPFIVDITKYNLEHIAESLVFLDSEDSWKIREFLLEKSSIGDKGIVMPEKILKGLAGVDSDRSWNFRQKLVDDLVNKHKQEKWSVNIPFFQGLCGVNSSEAWRYRDMYLIDKNGLSFPDYSLIGLDNKGDDLLRKTYYENLMKGSSFPESLIGIDSDFAWSFRNKLLKIDPETVMDSLAGIDSEKAWEMRDKLLKLGVDTNHLLRSLTGVNSLLSWRLREKVWDKDEMPYLMAMSISGLDSNDAWRMRKKILDKGGAKYIPISINGNHISGTVWRMVRNKQDKII
ncbi:MAG: hypothetical protein WCO35_02600 [Candidatus Nomurabacteria bacterium]